MPRTGPRGGPRTRARIAEVAGRLFHERGFDAVTVAEVAREAGVSSVTVYNHFPRKEDLFLDRTEEAAELLRAAVRDRPGGDDVPAGLRRAVDDLVEAGHPLAGTDPRSLPFYRAVATSPSLLARAREIGSELEGVLAAEIAADRTFDGDGDLLAALFVAGYAAVLAGTARRLLAGEERDVVLADHRARFGTLAEVLRRGFA